MSLTKWPPEFSAQTASSTHMLRQTTQVRIIDHFGRNFGNSETRWFLNAGGLIATFAESASYRMTSRPLHVVGPSGPNVLTIAWPPDLTD